MEDKITEKQSSKLHYMYRDMGINDAEKETLLQKFGVKHTSELSKLDASTLIDELTVRGTGAPKEEFKMPDYKKDETPQKNIIQSVKSEYVEESALSPVQGFGIVRPMISPEDAVVAYKEYEVLKQKVITKDDVQAIQGKEYIKKSGWRKLATFFNLSDEIVEETREPAGTGFIWRIKVRVTAPNGRTSIGVGSCDSKERNFAHIEHDVYATAHTRSKNRAISDMIGGGAVSAEEMDA